MATTPGSDTLTLNSQLCFALYAATHAITRAYRGLLSEIGLTYPQYLVVLALLEQPVMTVGGLAQSLQVDAATLTPLLKRLEAAGLLERRRREGDERVVDVSLTPAGRGLHRDLSRIHQAVNCQTGLSPDTFAALRATLHDLTQSLHNCRADAA